MLCVLCVQCASQMPHQRWVDRAAERCLDATSSVGVCWCVLVCTRVGVTCVGVCVGVCSCVFVCSLVCVFVLVCVVGRAV